jgi:hypothetical protein
VVVESHRASRGDAFDALIVLSVYESIWFVNSEEDSWRVRISPKSQPVARATDHFSDNVQFSAVSKLSDSILYDLKTRAPYSA